MLNHSSGITDESIWQLSATVADPYRVTAAASGSGTPGFYGSNWMSWIRLKQCPFSARKDANRSLLLL